MASSADNRRGIAAMLTATTVFVGNDMMVREAAASLPTGAIMAMRGLLATAVVAVVVARLGPPGAFGHLLNPRVAMRGAIEGTIAVLFITALPRMLFADLTAILLAASLATTGIAVLLGLETVGIRRWTALAVGFAGVIVVLRPGGGSGVSAAALLAVASMLLVAVRDIVTRRIRSEAPTMVIALGSTLAVSLAGLLIGPFESGWRWPTAREAALLAGAAIAVAIANSAMIAAFRNTDIAVVAPFRYTALPLAALLGFLVWGEKPDHGTIIGGAMIVGSGVYTIWRESVRAQAAQKAKIPA